MSAQLPCGGCCPVQVYRISLTGAIPYIINVGSVKSGCGSSVCLSVSGGTMVDEVVGYAGGSEPDLTELSCGSVTPSVNVSTEQCSCHGGAQHDASAASSFPTCGAGNRRRRLPVYGRNARIFCIAL